MKTNIRLFTLLAVLTVTTHMYASTSANQIIPEQTKGVILPGQTQTLLNYAQSGDVASIVTMLTMVQNQPISSTEANQIISGQTKGVILPGQTQTLLNYAQSGDVASIINMLKNVQNQPFTGSVVPTSGGSTRPVNQSTTAIK
jgi:hypothetical protein